MTQLDPMSNIGAKLFDNTRQEHAIGATQSSTELHAPLHAALLSDEFNHLGLVPFGRTIPTIGIILAICFLA